jgi:hypothetical protein
MSAALTASPATGSLSCDDRTHGDAGTLELLADRAPMNAQLGTDLAQRSTLRV